MSHADDCETRRAELYETMLKEAELTANNLSVVAVFATSSSIMFSIFSSVIFVMVNSSVAAAQLRWLTLLIFNFVVALFYTIEFVISNKFLYSVFIHSPTWFKLLSTLAQMFRTFSIFLLTNFLTSLLMQSWLSSHFNVIETMCGVWSIFLAVYFLLMIFRK